MKRSDVSFDNWIVSEDIELIIDGSYDSGWWEDFFHNDYCYAYNDKNQNENFGDYQISLYFKNVYIIQKKSAHK